MYKVGDIVKLNYIGRTHYNIDIVDKIDYFTITEVYDITDAYLMKPNILLDNSKYYVTYSEYIDYHSLHYRRKKIEHLLKV